MNREQAINYLFSCGFTNEQVGDVVRALTYEPTTKNDLGVDCISRADAIQAMQDKAKKLTNEDTINGLCGAVAILFDLPSVSSVFEKNSKKLEKDFGELDCISRADAIRVASGYCHPSNVAKELANLPSVTPQEPRCKECKWWKDSDGAYRRGVKAESQCPINRREVFEGNGYCYMFSPMADMREVEE